MQPLLLPGLRTSRMRRRSCAPAASQGDLRRHPLLPHHDCANHPLVIGVLAGLINSPGPHRGNFDGWAADPDDGAKLNLASLDLIQSRNHILRAALDALSPEAASSFHPRPAQRRRGLRRSKAFNPHLPPERGSGAAPPEDHWRWRILPDEEKAATERQYETALPRGRTMSRRCWPGSIRRRSATLRRS